MDDESLHYLVEMAMHERAVSGWDGEEPLPKRLMAVARAIADEHGLPVERLITLCIRELQRRDAREKSFRHQFGPAYRLTNSFEPPRN